MKIAVIGTGKMGRGFATALHAPRHEVVFGSRDPEKVGKIARATGAADAVFPAEAAATAMMPVTERPQVGRFSWITDPQGAAIAFIQRAPERRR